MRAISSYLRLLFENRFSFELAGVFRERPGRHVPRPAGRDRADKIMEKWERVLAVVRGRRRGVVGMRVVEAEQGEALFRGQSFHAQVVLRRDLVAPRALGRADVVDPLDRNDLRRLPLPPEKRPDALLGIGLAAVRPDLIHDVLRQRDHSALQKSSERYRPPPSHRTVTIVAGSDVSRAARTAAVTFAPEDGPTKRPSSFASRRHIS